MILIKEIEFCGLPGFPDGTKYSFGRKINILHGSDWEKMTLILEAIQYILDPVYMPSSFPNEENPVGRTDIYVKLQLEEANGRILTLKRSLKDPSMLYLDDQSVREEKYFLRLENDQKTPQLVYLDGNLIDTLGIFSSKDWLSWMKFKLELVESLDETFGPVLDVSEREKRRAKSTLTYTGEKLDSMAKLIDNDKRLTAIRVVRAEKELAGVKAVLKRQKDTEHKLQVVGRQYEKELLRLNAEGMRLKNENSYQETQEVIKEVQDFMNKEIIYPEIPGNASADELKTLLDDLMEKGIDGLLTGKLEPRKHSSDYRMDLAKLCLTFTRIPTFLKGADGLTDYMTMERKRKETFHTQKSDYVEAKDKIVEIWRTLKRDYRDFQADSLSYEANSLAIKAKEVTINHQLLTHYKLHLDLLQEEMKAEQCVEEMVNLRKAMKIDQPTLYGMALIEDLHQKNELPFPSEDYYGPLYKYLIFENINMNFLMKFMHILKPLYTMILIRTRHEAQMLLDLHERALKMGDIKWDFIILEELVDLTPDHLPRDTVFAHECLCDSRAKEALSMILSNVIYSDSSDGIPGAIVFNHAGDFVDQRDEMRLIGGGTHDSINLQKFLTDYFKIMDALLDSKEDAGKVLMAIQKSSVELDRQRQDINEMDRSYLDVGCIRRISNNVFELYMGFKNFFSVKWSLQKTVDSLGVFKDATELLKNEELEIRSVYEKRLEMMMTTKEPSSQDPTDKKILDFIKKLYTNNDHIGNLLKHNEWANLYGGKVIFQLPPSSPPPPPSSTIDDSKEILRLLTEDRLHLKEKLKNNEKMKSFAKGQIEMMQELLEKCKVNSGKQTLAETRFKNMYAKLSHKEILEELDKETQKFRDLTGFKHFCKLNWKVFEEFKRWNNRHKTLSNKLERLHKTETNEHLLISDYRFSLQQIQEFRRILGLVSFIRRDGTLYHFSFLLQRSTGVWFDCATEATQSTTLNDIIGIKWITVEHEDATKFKEISPDERDLCHLTAFYAMSILNSASIFLVDIKGIIAASECSEEDIRMLFYNIINHHQAISISQQPIIDILFNIISVE